MAENIVYSTNPNWENPNTKQATEGPLAGQSAILLRERKGRGGKAVTVIRGLKGDLKNLQKELQKYCGSGGTFKNGCIELQGEQRRKAAEYLEAKGIKVKISGG